MPVRRGRDRLNNNADANELNGEPYERRTMPITVRGVTKNVSALNLVFVTNRTFVPYETPPYFQHLQPKNSTLQDLNSIRDKPESAEIEEWLDKTEFFKEDLHWLLRLPYHKYYDMKNPIVTVEMESITKEIHRLVFLVFLRMSTHKESQDCHMSPSVHADFIYNYHLLDIPKLMDLCVLYGRENRQIIQKAVENVMETQHLYLDDLKQCLRCIPQSFDFVREQLGVWPVDGPNNLLVDGVHRESSIRSMTWEQLEDIIVYIVDTAATLFAFQEIYPKTCHAMHEEHLETSLIDFYEDVFPIIIEEVSKRIGNIDCDISMLQTRLGFAKTCFVKLFRSIIQYCYMTPLVENSSSSTSDSQIQLVDKYLEVMSSVLMEKRPNFICDYESCYPFEDDVEIIIQLNFPLDLDRIEYIYKCIRASFEALNRTCPSGLSTPRDHASNKIQKSSQFRSSQVENDDGDVINHASTSNDIDYLSLDGACAGPILDREEIEQLVAKVMSMLPDLSPSFVEACLEYYNFSSERVIDAILEETLPPSLAQLDRTATDYSRPQIQDTSFSKRRNIYDNDEFDVFTRDKIDTTRVHKGKRDDTFKAYAKDEAVVAITKALSSKLSIVEAAGYENDLLYEDEYDDTYDSTMLGPSDDTLEEEFLLRRPFQKPRVLESSTDREGQEEGSGKSEEEDENEAADDNKKVKDEFVPNPELLREAAARKRQERHHNSQKKSYDVKGRPKGHGQDDATLRNRNRKTQNKAHVANHNRRAGAERKRRQGMIPS